MKFLKDKWKSLTHDDIHDNDPYGSSSSSDDYYGSDTGSGYGDSSSYDENPYARQGDQLESDDEFEKSSLYGDEDSEINEALGTSQTKSTDGPIRFRMWEWGVILTEILLVGYTILVFLNIVPLF